MKKIFIIVMAIVLPILLSPDPQRVEAEEGYYDIEDYSELDDSDDILEVDEVEAEELVSSILAPRELDEELDANFKTEVIEAKPINIQGLSDASIFQPTNLPVDVLNGIVAGTQLEGVGEALAKIEEEYGVNALFALSVARAESGEGTSKLAKTNNNFFGMRGVSKFHNMSKRGFQAFPTKSDAFIGFAELINRKYRGKTIANFARTYCPPNPQHWIGLITRAYGVYLQRVGKLI